MGLWLIINVALLLMAYLLGSIPSGYVAGRLLKGIDLRQEGSGSTGATNVLRTLGKWPALVVLLADMGKGALAIACVGWLYSFVNIENLTPAYINPEILPYWMTTFTGLAAIVGHSKSIWLNFQGGKSAATSLGILFAIYWPVGLATLGIFLGVLGITQIVSISSMAAAIACSGLMIFLHQPLPYQLFATLGGLYVIWLHRSNIQRLLAGTEPKLGEKLSQDKTKQELTSS